MKKSFVALALALCLTPGIASAAIQVNGVSVEKDSNNTIYIAEDKAVITGIDTDAVLHIEENVSELTFQNVSIMAPDNDAALVMPVAQAEIVTLNFEGINTLVGKNGSDGINSGNGFRIHLVDGAEVTLKSVSSSGNSRGGNAAFARSLTIDGKGTLKALGGDCYALSEYGYGEAGHGVHVEGSLTIGKDVTVIAKAGDAHCKGVEYQGCGIYLSKDLKVEGSLIAMGGNGTIYGGEGIQAYGECIVADNASVKATGGNGSKAGGYGVDIYESMEIGGTVEAAGGDGGETGGYGVYTGELLEISGTVEAAGGDGGTVGGRGVHAYESLKISGTVEATGGDGGTAGGYGVYGYESLEISGTVTATGGNGKDEGQDGIYSRKLLEISGKVKTAGGNGKELGGDGIDGRGKMIIGGDVTAKGGAGENAGGNGVEIEEDGAKIVLDGKLRAEGGSGAAAGVGLSNVDGETVVSGDVMILSGGDGVAAIEGKRLTLDGVFGGESRDGKEWWDTITSTMRYFASFAQRQKVMSLPQTGDDSSLGLWLALLFVAGVGMLRMRKRVHN